VNPNTGKQATIRQQLEDLSEDWKTLSEAQRDAWTALGVQMIRQDTLGQSYTLTGLQAFTSLNMVLLQSGASSITAAPAMPGGFPNFVFGAVTYQAGGTGFDLAFTPTPIGGAFKVQIEATGPVSAGINFMPRSEYKRLESTALNGASPLDETAEYELIYGVPPEGSKIFYRGRVANADGFVGGWVSGTLIVTIV
jgi:hypothetical protein